MATRKVLHPKTREAVDAEIVGINDIEGDTPIIIRLTDGTVLRMKIDVIDAARIPNLSDSDGNPFCAPRSGNIMTALEAPENLRISRENGVQ